MTEYHTAINEVQAGLFEPEAYSRACASSNGEASLIHANYVVLRVHDLLRYAAPAHTVPPPHAESAECAEPPPQTDGSAVIGARLVRLLGVVLTGAGFGIGASRYAVFGALATPLLASALIIFGVALYQSARTLHPHLLHWLIRWPLVFILWFSVGFPIYSVLDEWKREEAVRNYSQTLQTPGVSEQPGGR